MGRSLVAASKESLRDDSGARLSDLRTLYPRATRISPGCEYTEAARYWMAVLENAARMENTEQCAWFDRRLLALPEDALPVCRRLRRPSLRTE